MKKHVFGRQFKRDINERKSLFKNLMTQLVMHERIQTTEEKAKAIRGSVEKLVTHAKKKGIAATPQLLPYLHEDAVKRMIADVAPRFSTRPGGYTRIIKLGRRFGDDASTVIIEWVEKSAKSAEPRAKSEKAVKTKKATTEVVVSGETVESAVALEAKDRKEPKKTKVVKETKKKTVKKESK